MRAKRDALVGLMVAAVCWSGTAGAATTAQTCEAAKVTAAGEKLACLATERAKEVTGKSFNYDKCDASFLMAFEKAEDKAGPGICPTVGDAAAVDSLIDTCFEDIQSGSSACAADLATCTTNLATCNANLTQAEAALTQAETAQVTCNANLTQAVTNLATCQATAQHLPATGQTTCWNLAGTSISCDPGQEGSGHDGGTLAGATLGYTDNGNGTITDNNTGLMWEKKSLEGTPATNINHRDKTYTWPDTFAVHITGLNAGAGFAGHTGWRMPNIKELQGIVNYENLNPAVSREFNDQCVAGCTVLTCSCTFEQSNATYWSSSTSAYDRSNAWILGFANGSVFYAGKFGAGFVRAVRGGS